MTGVSAIVVDTLEAVVATGELARRLAAKTKCDALLATLDLQGGTKMLSLVAANGHVPQRTVGTILADHKKKLGLGQG